jgi:hypothetical protein
MRNDVAEGARGRHGVSRSVCGVALPVGMN